MSSAPRARLLLLMAAACCAWSAPATAEVFPADSGVLDVRLYGAVGDGVHDDTAALQAAIAAAQIQTRFFWPTRIVYLPAGRYLVRDTLRSMDARGHYQAQLALIGDGPGKTSVVLADHAAGFDDVETPKAVLYTSSGLRGGDPTDGGKRYLELGEGNDAYANYVEGLTIDVGEGNPGAIALDFLANNIGSIRDVVLRARPGSGLIGLAMERRWPGPLLVTGVTIEGFQVGISVKHPEYGVTLEHVVLRGQAEIALRNSGNTISMRDVRIETAAIGIANEVASGLIVADAVRFVPTGKHALFARNVGYLTLRRAMSLGGRPQASRFERGGTFLGSSALSAFGPQWRLPAPPSATRPVSATGRARAALPPPSQWANVVMFGARPDSDHDSTAAIQAALSSGARAVYLPTGRYAISRPLEVPASVQHIAGMMSVLSVGKRVASFTREQGMLRVRSSGGTLTVQRLALDHMGKGGQVGFEHAGARSVVLRDFIGGGVKLCRRATGGPLVLENTVGPLDVSGPAGVWASQLNIEGQGILIRNQGTPLAILGLKTEQNATVLENVAGGQTEILGGLFYMVFPPAQARPALTNAGVGRVFAAYSESAYRPGAIYTEHMVQLEPGTRRVRVRATDLPARGLGRVSPGQTMRGSTVHE